MPTDPEKENEVEQPHRALEDMTSHALNVARQMKRHVKKRIPAKDRDQIALLHQWLHVLAFPPQKALKTLDKVNLGLLPSHAWAEMLSASSRPDLTLHVSKLLNIDWPNLSSSPASVADWRRRFHSQSNRSPQNLSLWPTRHPETSWWVTEISHSACENSELLQVLLDAQLMSPSSLIPSPCLGGSEVTLANLSLAAEWADAPSIWQSLLLDKKTAPQSLIALALSQSYSTKTNPHPLNELVWAKIVHADPDFSQIVPLCKMWADDLGWANTQEAPCSLLVLSLWCSAQRETVASSRTSKVNPPPKFPGWEIAAVRRLARSLASLDSVDDCLIQFAKAMLCTSQCTNNLMRTVLEVLVENSSPKAHQEFVRLLCTSHKNIHGQTLDPRMQVRQMGVGFEKLNGLADLETSINFVNAMIKLNPPFSSAPRQKAEPLLPQKAQEVDALSIDFRQNLACVSFWAQKKWEGFISLLDPSVQEPAKEHLEALSRLGSACGLLLENRSDREKMNKNVLSWVAQSSANWTTTRQPTPRKF